MKGDLWLLHHRARREKQVLVGLLCVLKITHITASLDRLLVLSGTEGKIGVYAVA